MLKLILAFAVMMIGVSGHPDFHQRNPNSKPSNFGGPTIQFLTRAKYIYANGLFFDDNDKILYACDRFTTDCYIMNFKTGEKKHFSVDVSEGQVLAFKYPASIQKEKFPNAEQSNISTTEEPEAKYGFKEYVIGTENELIGSTVNLQTHIELHTQPVAITKDKGYVICNAHADKNGKLFITMNSITDKKHKHGRLYKMMGKIPDLVKQFDSDVHDFVWSHDYKTMYLIAHDGKCIEKYSYDENAMAISNEEIVFELPKYAGAGDCMTGIEIDSEDCLWVTVEGCGVVLQIDSKTGETKQAIQMPVSMLTGLTFAGKDNPALIISTSKKCKKREYGAGAILYLAGINGTGVGDNTIL